MVKNGLWLVSIGLLMFMFSVNRITLKYNIFLMVTSVSFILLGTILAVKGTKKEKKNKEVKK